VLRLVTSRHILAYRLEAVLRDAERGVAVRRSALSACLPDPHALARLPFKDYDYSKVRGGHRHSVIVINYSIIIIVVVIIIGTFSIRGPGNR